MSYRQNESFREQFNLKELESINNRHQEELKRLQQRHKDEKKSLEQ